MHTRLAVLVDGFNLFHSIQDVVASRKDAGGLKWLDLWKLGESFKPQVSRGGEVELVSVDYFSAFANHKRVDDPGHVIRHQVYIRALKSRGVRCHMHRFKGRHRDCKLCSEKIKFHEEKETDVAIAVQLVRIFVEESADAVLIVSGDTDLSPAVRTVYEMFPDAIIGFAFPFSRKSAELAKLVQGRGVSFKLSERSYVTSQLPNPLEIKRGRVLHRPEEWS